MDATQIAVLPQRAPLTGWRSFAIISLVALLAEPMLTEIHMWRVCDAEFEIDGRRHGVFGHGWRVEPADEWLRRKAERASRIEDSSG